MYLGIPKDDYEQERALIIAECAAKRDESLGDFEHYVARSLLKLRRIARLYRPLGCAGYDVDWLPAPILDTFDEDWLLELSEDGARAVRFFLQYGAGRKRTGARTLAKAFGWSPRRAKRCFEECREWWARVSA